MRTLAATLLLLLGLAHHAAACPRPPEGVEFHCAKYDRMRHRVDPREVQHRVTSYTYIRAAAARLPRHASRARLVAILTHARWNPAPGHADGLGPIRLIDGADVPDSIRRWAGVRNTIVREIGDEPGHYQINFDDTWYTLTRCRDAARRPTTCLVPSS